MEDVKKQIFDNFRKFITSQPVESDEVCIFIKSLLVENDYKYRPTGCYGDEWKLQDE